MARPLKPVILTPAQRTCLQQIVNCRSNPHQLVRRAQIIFHAAQGMRNQDLSRKLGLSEDSVGLWRQRWLNRAAELDPFEQHPKRLHAAMIAQLSDQPRSGSPCTFTPEQVCQITALACDTPPEHLSHWTQEGLATEAMKRGIVKTIPPASIGRFLKSGKLKTTSSSVLAQSSCGG